MNLLIKSAIIVDPSSKFNGQTCDILIKEGIIEDIAPRIEPPSDFKELSLPHLHVSQGWFDSSVSFGEPGFEERETVENGLKTAGLSGFTDVAINPSTNPVTDSKASVLFLKGKAAGNPVNLWPVGALTKHSEGEDLAELYDMKNAGAVAFFDYEKPVRNPNLLKLALQYASTFEGLVMSFPQESRISGLGVMNEHLRSTSLGLKGNPALAEELQIVRDLFILEYTGGKLHIPTISTAKSVELIREAKEKNLDVSCSVAIHNLLLTDDELSGFDTRYKVLPPLRTSQDIEELLEGVKDHTIDMVTSDHNPWDIEHKKIEFDYAAYGTIGLESAFGALNSILGMEKTVDLLTRGKNRFSLNEASIDKGSTACLSLFNPKDHYVFEKSHIISTSKNAIFEEKELKGMAYGIFAHGQLLIH